MSYSRWGNSRWYTYMAATDLSFVICGVCKFKAYEIRQDVEVCLDHVDYCEGGRIMTNDEREELKGYMLEYLKDYEAAKMETHSP